MLNNQLKNNIAPWQEKGRWYTVFIESTGSALKITNSDIEGTSISSANLVMPIGFHIIDYKLDAHTIGDGSSHSTTQVNAINSAGKQYVAIMQAQAFDYAYVYVFGYFEEPATQVAMAKTMNVTE